MTSRRAWTEQVMGMPISIHLRGPGSDAVRQTTVDAVFAELREADRVFSLYRDDSDIARLRRGEIAAEQCHPTVSEVLALCERAARVTAGYFDAWRPDADSVVRLDPSGLVKGWAVERAARHLAALDGEDYYLNAGGDIALRAASQPWRIGVEDPLAPAALIGVLELVAGGIATSGTAHRGAHIVDPFTGQPATALASVTVVGPSLMWADVYATAAFARGADAIDWFRWPAGYDALAVAVDGRRTMTPGLPARLAP